MKKLLLCMVFTLAVLFSLTSCNQKPQANVSFQTSNVSFITSTIEKAKPSSIVSSEISSSEALSSSEILLSTIPEEDYSHIKHLRQLNGYMLRQTGALRGTLGTHIAHEYVIVDKGNKLGLVDYSGNIVLPIKYKRIHFCFEGLIADEYVFSEDLKTSKFHGGHGYERGIYCWDTVSNSLFNSFCGYGPVVISELRYTQPIPVQSVKMRAIKDMGEYVEYEPISVKGKYGFSKNGKLTIPLIYDSIHPFNEGLAAVKKDGLWGYIKEDGTVAIDFQFDDNFEANMKHTFIGYDKDIPYNFSSGFVAVCKGEKWGYIDKNGKEITPFNYSFALMPYQGKAWVYNDKGEWLVIDLNALENE